MKLKNRVAVVTGGSSGIGRGICLEFAREGASVIAADIEQTPKRDKNFATDTPSPTVEEIERLGFEGAFVQTDVADEHSVRRLSDGTVARFGGLDILVNNAGINSSSVMAFEDGSGSADSAAKAGVFNLTRDIAVEVASNDVTVIPSALDTLRHPPRTTRRPSRSKPGDSAHCS